MNESIPVTILSGTLGVGKTTVLNHILTNDHGLDVAVVVNDMGEINVDAHLIERRVENENVIEFSNGCICCSLQGDLEKSIIDLGLNEDFRYLIVEPSGISDPKSVAQLFQQGRPSGFYEIDSVTTVINAREFYDSFNGREVEREGNQSETRPLADLIVDGIEFCDTLIINKKDLVNDTELTEICEMVRTLQPSANFYITEFGEINPSKILDTGRFNIQTVESAASWKRALDDQHDSDDDNTARGIHMGESQDCHQHPPEIYNIDSFTYYRRCPMHPKRLAETLQQLPKGVIRTKGLLHVAGRPKYAMNLSVAGEQAHVDVAGRWIDSLSEGRKNNYRKSQDIDWDDTWGDRETQLVIIGKEIDIEAIETMLDKCLCSEGEQDINSGDNPFPQEEGEYIRL